MKTRKPKKLRTNIRSHLLIGFLLAGGVAAVATGGPRSVAHPQKGDSPHSVWVASKPVARGQRISEVPLTRIPWPKESLSGEHLDREVLTPSELSLTATVPIAANTPISLAALTHGALSGNPVAESIPEGLRAITIGVDAESSVEGWVRAGSSVDIILREQREGRLFATVVASNVRVLSADRTTTSADGRPRQSPATVSVLVSQDEALKIILAKEIGELSLSLRGPTDDAPTTARSIDDRRLLGHTQEREKTEPIGFAKGPDGQIYSLRDNKSRPVRVESPTSQPPSPASPPHSMNAAPTTMTQPSSLLQSTTPAPHQNTKG